VGFRKQNAPSVDYATWRTGTRAEKIKPMAQHWAEVGFGTPVVLHLFYVAKIAAYVLGGWLLTFDLRKPIEHYGYTPFLAGAVLCFIGAVFSFCFKKPAHDRSPDNVAVGV
jgi:hypothetical protein